MTDPSVTRILYGGRTLLAQDDDGERVEGWADLAHESIRAMNHITSSGGAIPAPVAYSVLGNISGAAHMIIQLCEQLGRGLEKSLTEFDVYDRKGDPGESVAAAVAALQVARAHARSLGEALDAAQVAINSQGYNDAVTRAKEVKPRRHLHHLRGMMLGKTRHPVSYADLKDLA
jgi:hypothetical protein